ncbi:hypothetical protein ABBQ32_013076 [Trebouxia sp. C0010 RCD-2024]
MDYVDRLRGRSQTFSLNKALKFTDISPSVQSHLEKVYLTLTGMLLLSAVGVSIAQILSLGTWIPVIGFAACMFFLVSTHPTAFNLNKRYGLLAGCALFEGATLGPLVQIVLATHPGILVTAFLGTSTVFACFSAAALLSRRRSWLYLGGALSSAMSVLLLMRLGSYFLGGRAFVFQAELYVGLLVFIGYVLFDTQVIVEKAERGDRDHIKHALDLFVDFAAIFVRILVIMLQNSESREEKSDRRRRRR